METSQSILAKQSSLSKAEEETWDALTKDYNKVFVVDYDVNALYPVILGDISAGVEPVMKKGGLGVRFK